MSWYTKAKERRAIWNYKRVYFIIGSFIIPSCSHFELVQLAKNLPHYRRQLLCRVPQALGKGQYTLGKYFASKGRSVNSLSAKTSLPSALYRALGKGFAECQSDTRQRKVAVTASATVTMALLSVKVKHSAKVAALPSAIDLDTRQRWPLCRVPPARHSTNRRPLPSAWPVALGKSVMFAEYNGMCTRQSMFTGMFSDRHFAECHDHCTRQSD